MKDANKTHVLSGKYLKDFYREALKQGKTEACYIVTFLEAGITIECRVRRSDGPSNQV